MEYRNLRIFKDPACVLFPGIQTTIRIKLFDINLRNQPDKYYIGETVAFSTLRVENNFVRPCDVGVIAEIISIEKKPDSTYFFTFLPKYRARFINEKRKKESLYCDAEIIDDFYSEELDDEAFFLHIKSIERKYNKLKDTVRNVTFDFSRLVGETVSGYINRISDSMFQSREVKQEILETADVYKRAIAFFSYLESFIEINMREFELDREVSSAIEKRSEKDFLLEKYNYIKNELHIEERIPEYDQLEEKLSLLPLDDEYMNKIGKELNKLSYMPPTSPDANVIRTYLEELCEIPWGVYDTEQIPIKKSISILEGEHFGLEKVKQRFIELVAVMNHCGNPGAQIICLVGPPGVGKTSIVKSVAKALGKKYVRLSLGGVHDEAEIRGHRKTYVGAMSGRIVRALKEAKTMNPVILLDEIDKLAQSVHGDPASALLEVLDPAQNSTFHDNYVEIPVDLSKVVFVTTANDPSTIPGPLKDRMEIITLPGYTRSEKLQIASKFLVKKQRKLHELNASQIKIPKSVLAYIIDNYTSEAGVRALEKKIAALCRKTVLDIESGECTECKFNVEKVTEALGVPMGEDDIITGKNLVGVVNGLAWTSVGGTMLQLESVIMPGTGKIEITGSLGDVMTESAKTALSYIRSKAAKYGIDDSIFKQSDVHIHAPQGAIPKDGPSAGVTIATALLSVLTGRTVNSKVAMTGEITLTGRVFAIGGLREKSMAAFQHKMTDIIVPASNKKDLAEISDEVKQALNFHFVDSVDEVFEIALNP